ncbi:Uma2 family endonuclease [Catellatospora methionotrophica]|uniref:Uma2 family endonuclease n=1 Tax=Catellatospora methionotrophica TaxID=121620 RepID=UPI0033C74260
MIEEWSEVEQWTAELALRLLPETNGPTIEVFCGIVIVSPHANMDHQTIMREIVYRLHHAARGIGCWAYPESNLISGDDLFIPDFGVFRVSGSGKVAMNIADALLLGEIVLPGNRRKDIIDRPKQYAAAGVPWFMRVECRNRVPVLALHSLVDGEYRPVAAAAAGTRFVMREPFVFEIDPADLLDE